MKSKVLEKLLIVMLILTLTTADFFVLGFNIISYAVDLNNTTNNENIDFFVYFKDEEGNRINTIEEKINKDNLKLYAEISVKNEGYFNGEIEVLDNNFNIKNEILSDGISKIEGNKIILKQINAGNNIEIEVGISPIKSEKIKLGNLSASTDIKLTGTYMNKKYKGIKIEGTKNVNLNYVADAENTEAQIASKIITNSVFNIKGVNKRVIQMLVKSKLTDNNYPVKQNTLFVDIPETNKDMLESIKAIAIKTNATNGEEGKIISDEWNKLSNEKNQLVVKVENGEEDNISWKKNSVDEFIVTYIYDEQAQVIGTELTANIETEVYNSEAKFNNTTSSIVDNQDLNNIITNEISMNNEELYKGQLYANTKAEIKKEIIFNSETKLLVSNTEFADIAKIKEEKDVFKTKNGEISANTRFVKTYISRENLINILGQDALITINAGNTSININKDSQIDENGNIVISYPENISELEIIASKPVSEGILKFNHEKAIMNNEYTIEQNKEIEGIKSSNTIAENTYSAEKELKETYTKTELSIDKTSLASMTNNDLRLGIKFLTYGTQYDLFKNPVLKIKLPQTVKEINKIKLSKLYGDEFETQKDQVNFDKENKILTIPFIGEQKEYAESEAKQLYIELNLGIVLEQTATNMIDKITMNCINENAINYADNGVEKEINITAPKGLITINNVSEINSITGINEKKQTLDINKDTENGKKVGTTITLVNNTDIDLNNVKVLGNFLEEGEFVYGEETIKNTLNTTSTPINVENATVYYSNNDKATDNLDDVNNRWETDLSKVEDAKMYLIEIPNMKAGGSFKADYSSTLPAKLDYDLESYSGYKVSYSGEIDGKVESNLIGMATEKGMVKNIEDVKIETNITATVGNDEIKNGDAVKNGEVIKYKITAKNTGDRILKDVVLKGQVPEGTVYVEPEENYEYSGLSYYQEKPEVNEMTKTITLEPGQEEIMEYEVRVKKDTANESSISNKSTVVYGEFKIDGNELNNTVSESKVRITLKNIYGKENIRTSGVNEVYVVFVENLGNEETDVKVKIDIAGQSIRAITDGENEIGYDKKNNTVDLGKISAGETKWFDITTTIEENVEEITAQSIATDKNGTYRSNKDMQVVEQPKAEITLSTPNYGDYIDIGDEVIYNYKLVNSSKIPEDIELVDQIPEELRIQEILVNNNVEWQTYNNNAESYVKSIANNVNYSISTGAGETKNVTIKAKVKPINGQYDSKTISNSAQAKVKNDVKSTSGEVIHYLKGNISEDIKNIISGIAWLDQNQNGQKDQEDTILSDITVRLLDAKTNKIAVDKDGNSLETKTNGEGIYTFNKVKDGEYIVIFEYDTTKFEPTLYKKEGVGEGTNSNVIAKEVKINDEVKGNAVTDIIKVTDSVYNINIGLRENLKYDLELGKYISKITVKNSKGTKTYDYSQKDETFKKIEIHSKQLAGSVVVLEYTIKVRNTGEIAGYVTNIKDYLPSGLTFSSELNPEWYLSGKELSTKSLANVKINPGETKEVKLTLTKTMTASNTGLLNNRAEIAETYNDLGKLDIDSNVNNQLNGEDDLGSADVIIGISTGARNFVYIALILINAGLISLAVRLIFKKNKGHNW